MTTTKGVITQTAHAKINLSLHVTGQRDDGYHLLDSLVMFTSLGDEITVRDADDLSLTITGPFADGLPTDDRNLVVQAAKLMAKGRGIAITLHKNLPLASGIGGGSADAAATLFALSNLWDMPLPDWADVLKLGADVPLCLSTEISHMRGIGDDIKLIGPSPMLDILLVNPMVKVSTPAIFKALDSKNNPPMGDTMPDPFDTEDWVEWISDQRNDLETPAIEAAPVVATVITALRRQHGCRLARMSGSGATCFAIFEDFETCEAAQLAISQANPKWWVAQTDEAPV